MILVITDNKTYEYKKLSEALKYHVCRSPHTNAILTSSYVTSLVSKAKPINGVKKVEFRNLKILKINGQNKKLVCDVCGSDDVIEFPHMGKNCNRCHPLQAN